MGCGEAGAAAVSSPGDHISPELTAEGRLELPDLAQAIRRTKGLTSWSFINLTGREVHLLSSDSELCCPELK